MSDAPFLWGFPKAIPNLVATQVVITIHSVKPGPNNNSAVVAISSDALALYVVLTTKASGRFDENAFVLRPHETKVSVYR